MRLTFDLPPISELFKKVYSNLANDLFKKLRVAAKIFGIKSAEFYCKNLFDMNRNKLRLQTIQTNSI